MTLLTHRAVSSPRSKARRDDDEEDDAHRAAADSLEAGSGAVSSSSPFSSSRSAGRQNQRDVLFVIRKPSAKTTYCFIWGSILCINYLMWAHQLLSTQHQQQQQQQPLPKSMPRIPASTKWLFDKPPTLKQMYNLRNCESSLATYDEATGKRIDSKSLPIYTEEQWEYFRKIWRAQGGQDVSKQYKKNDRRRSHAPPDLVPPFKAGQTKDGKGRGVFATRDIKKGEMIYGSTKNYIFFTTGHDYRRFLDALDDETACDIMKFTWPQKNIGPKGEALIWGPMDDNAFQNDGGRKRSNTGCPRGKYCGNVSKMNVVCLYRDRYCLRLLFFITITSMLLLTF